VGDIYWDTDGEVTGELYMCEVTDQWRSVDANGAVVLRDLCTSAGNTPEDADCGGPDGTIDGEDLQRQIYLSCAVQNFSGGEACGSIILPEGQIDVATTLVVGDDDYRANTFGFSGAYLDGSDSLSNPQDGRVTQFTLIGQGAGKSVVSNDGYSGTTLRWTGTTNDPIMELRSAGHVTMRGIQFLGWDGTNARADKCLRLVVDEEYGLSQNSEGSIFEDLSCVNVLTVAFEIDDGDTMTELSTSTNTLNGALSGAAETAAVVNTAIASTMPASGDIRIVTSGGTKQYPYTSFAGSTYTVSDAACTANRAPIPCCTGSGTGACESAWDFSTDSAADSAVVSYTHNGKSENVTWRDIWSDHVPIIYRHNSDNTQQTRIQSLHATDFGNKAVSNGCVDTTPADSVCDADLGEGEDTTPVSRFAGTDVDSCGGGSGEPEGSATTACGMDIRQGDLEVIGLNFAAGGDDETTDVGVQIVDSFGKLSFKNGTIEANAIGAHFRTEDGADVPSGAGQFMLIENMHLFNTGSTGATQKLLDFGANGNYLIDGLEASSQFGDTMVFDIDTLSSGETMFNARNIRLNTQSTAETGHEAFYIDPDGDGNISGTVQWRVNCDYRWPATDWWCT
jgi:hypothetical protein